jgi:hypothetical protein
MYLTMGELLLLGLAGVISGWIILTLMGGERQRQLQQVESVRRSAQALAAATAAEAAKKSQPAPSPRQSAR